jgi:predicted NBD/HSP70 family sugar kinase
VANGVLINESRILREIWLEPGISRIGLARALSLSKSAVTKIVGNFLDEQLLVLAESPDITNAKGRRPTGLYLNADLGVVLGIEMQTDRWYAVAHDLQGNRVDAMDAQTIAPELDLMSSVVEAIASAIEHQHKSGRRVLGAGVGLSGLVNPYEGTVLSSNPLGVGTPLQLTMPIQEHFGMPILVENDANCCSWKAMLETGSDRNQNFISLLGEFRPTRHGPAGETMTGPGIAVGLGLVIRDSVLHGTGFSAGEFQSVFKQTDNPTQFDLEPGSQAHLPGDAALLRKVVHELSRNVALLVNVLNMTRVVVFGDLAAQRDLVVPLLHEAIQVNWLYDTEVECAVDVDEDTVHAVASGAAGFVLHRVFSRPNIWDDPRPDLPEGIDLLRLAIAGAR